MMRLKEESQTPMLLMRSSCQFMPHEQYMDTMKTMVLDPVYSEEKEKKIHRFLESVSHDQHVDPILHETIHDWLTHYSKKECRICKMEIAQLLTMIGEGYNRFLFDVLDAFAHLIEEVNTSKVTCEILKGLGKIATKRESGCRRIIHMIKPMCHMTQGVRVMRCIAAVLFDIGYTWNSQKMIFSPAVKCLQYPDQVVKVTTIRAIETQLEGYWEKPTEILKDMVMYEGDFLVRSLSARVLGNVGDTVSFSVREAIFELIDLVGQQIMNMKRVLSNSKKEDSFTMLVKTRLKDTKRILKILIYYAKKYSCRSTR